MTVMVKYNEIVENSFIGIPYSPSSLELFYIAQVKSKSIATKHMVDGNGHVIETVQMFITVLYLEKVKETKHYIRYKMANHSLSFFHLDEVFATDINITDLRLTVDAYRS